MQEKKRIASLEVLRAVAMMMVVVLHFLGKGGLLVSLTKENLSGMEVLAWLLESFAIVAVNTYMMISGYFLCTSHFKLSRLLSLWLQVWMYSVGIGVISVMTGAVTGVEVDTHFYLTLLFPVSMGHYWFMTAYLFLYLLLPFLTRAIKEMTRAQLGMTTLLLLVCFSLSKSVLPVRFEVDGQGYDVLWYLCVFCLAAYVRRFGILLLEQRGRGGYLYLASGILIFGVTFLLRFCYLKTGSLGRMLTMTYEYNHILVLLASLGLFCAFLQLSRSERAERVFSTIPFSFLVKTAPLTLGVYLLHENIGVRYAWPVWLGASKVTNAGTLLLHTLLSVVIVYGCGVLVEGFRKGLMKRIGRLLVNIRLFAALSGKIHKLDQL